MMWTDSEDGELVGMLASRTMWDEAREIQREIEEIISGKLKPTKKISKKNPIGNLHRERYSYNDIAVIYRTNSYSLPFEQVFRRLRLRRIAKHMKIQHQIK